MIQSPRSWLVSKPDFIVPVPWTESPEKRHGVATGSGNWHRQRRIRQGGGKGQDNSAGPSQDGWLLPFGDWTFF